MKNNLQKQIDKKEQELKELKDKLKQESEKNLWLDIPEKGISITTKQMFNGKSYSKILKEVKEEEIADYDLLQELRNKGFKFNWKKYKFLKKFWVFVKNKDELGKSKGYVAKFLAGSDRADFDCFGDVDYSDSSLGVFLFKKIKKKNDNNKNSI